MKEVLFSGGGFEVTTGTLKTPRRAYDLRNVEMVSVRQPLLIICGGVGIGLLGFMIAFYRYLYAWENITLGASAVIVIIALPTLDPVFSATALTTLGASFGFMMPISTAPNALAYATGKVRVGEMIRAGIVFDVVGFALIMATLRVMAPLMGWT